MASTRRQLRDAALYHLDLVLWVMMQPDKDIAKLTDVIDEARTFRDMLARERMRDG